MFCSLLCVRLENWWEKNIFLCSFFYHLWKKVPQIFFMLKKEKKKEKQCLAADFIVCVRNRRFWKKKRFFFLDDWFFCVCLCFNPHFDHKRLKCTTILLQIKLKAWIVSSRGVFIRGKCYNWCVSDRKLHFISIWYTRLFTLLHSLCSHGHYQIFLRDRNVVFHSI